LVWPHLIDLNDVFHIWFAIPRLATVLKDDQNSADQVKSADVVIHTQVITNIMIDVDFSLPTQSKSKRVRLYR